MHLLQGNPQFWPPGQTARNLILDWSNGSRDRISIFWLRDNCPTAGDRNSAIRTFSLEDLPDGLALQSAELSADRRLTITWQPDGHVSHFDSGWLANNLPGRRRRAKSETWGCGTAAFPALDRTR